MLFLFKSLWVPPASRAQHHCNNILLIWLASQPAAQIRPTALQIECGKITYFIEVHVNICIVLFGRGNLLTGTELYVAFIVSIFTGTAQTTFTRSEASTFMSVLFEHLLPKHINSYTLRIIWSHIFFFKCKVWHSFGRSPALNAEIPTSFTA